MQKMLISVLAAALFVGGIAVAAAQNVGGDQTIAPQTAPNPDDPALRNPQSPTSSNRGDPGSEALNPQTGGPALGQGQQPAETIGQATGDRQIVPPNAQPDDAAKPVPPKAAEPGTVGSGSRTIGPKGSRNDPHTQGGKDVPSPDSSRPTMAPTQQR